METSSNNPIDKEAQIRLHEAYLNDETLRKYRKAQVDIIQNSSYPMLLDDINLLAAYDELILDYTERYYKNKL